MAKYCCICKRPLDNPEAPVLAMGAYGSPKCVCDECSALIETATVSHDYQEVIEACREIGNSLTRGDTGDIQIIESVNDIISSATERANAIKEGTYDFSLDEEVKEEEFDITEELEETEEDKAKDEKEAKIIKIIDTVTSWACGIMLVAALIFFIIKFVI
jgi:hypothetical protein